MNSTFGPGTMISAKARRAKASMWLAGIMIAAYSGAAREAAQFPARMGEDGGVTVIDVWMQHPTRRLLQQEMFTSLRRWTGQLPDQEISLDRTLTAMDEAGVERGLISAWYGPDGPLISNDEVAGWVAAHPDRLDGVASADIRSPRNAVLELRRAVGELGFRALRVVPWLWGLPPNHRLYYPVFAECIELGIPFMTQVGHTGPLRTSETGRPIPYLDDVALDFPDLVIVAGHIG